MKILFLSRWFPYPPDNGSKIRIYHLLGELAKQFDIDLVAFHSDPVSKAQISCLESICGSVRCVEYPEYRPSSVKALIGFFSRKPRFLVDTYSPKMSAVIRELATERNYDAVIASEIDMAPYARALSCRIKILEDLEISVFIDKAAAAGEGHLKSRRARLTLLKLKNYLASVSRDFDAVTAVSDLEAAKITAHVPSIRRLWVIPNGIEIQPGLGKGNPQKDTIVFAGSITYNANLDAVRYFATEVFPLILEKRPECRFLVTGRTGDTCLDELSAIVGLEFTGYLVDVRSFIRDCWVSVVPLRVGGGTRLKILESLAVGTPVVATSKGVEGLDLLAGRDVLVADTPRLLTGAVISILEDPNLRMRLAEHGRETVRNKYDWKSIGNKYSQYLVNVFSD